VTNLWRYRARPRYYEHEFDLPGVVLWCRYTKVACDKLVVVTVDMESGPADLTPSFLLSGAPTQAADRP